MSEAVLDANILLRVLTDEPREPADRAAAILATADGHRVELIVTTLTLAEVVYVLESVYGWQRQTIAERLIELVSAGVFQFLEQPILLAALAWYRDIGSLRFADAYVAAVAADRAQAAVISFDRALGRVPGITLMQEPASMERDLGSTGR
jgi:predicted nucleic acid-binding protein